MSGSTSKKSAGGGRSTRMWTIVLAIVLVLAVGINIALGVFSTLVEMYLGKGTYTVEALAGTENWDSVYNKGSYASPEEAKAGGAAVVEDIEAEGLVMLKNNGALPLTSSETNVTVFGRYAADPVFGGSGSGSVDASTAIKLKSALESVGLKVNGEVYAILDAYAADAEAHPKANIVMDDPDSSTYYIGEMPVENYDPAVASFASYGDAAIISIGRGGGEGGDLARDMAGWDDNYVAGQHQLELNQDEKDMIALAKANFDKVIVLLNVSTTMEMGVLEDDPDVDAILWIGSPGQSGFNSVAKVITGEINPSGRTADLWAADFTKDPTFVNFGTYQYENINSSNAQNNGFFVQYEEGIYIGYKYYETAAVENFIDYDEAVVYPFGFGLSYTTFDWEITNTQTGGVDGEIAVDVKVTNTGDVAGKDVVELYYSAPYTPGGIEKSAVMLGDFAKTGLLQPGASETVTLSLAVEDMASYDYKTEKAYVLDAGTYTITVQTDSHNVKNGCAPIEYSLSSKKVFSGDDHRASDEVAVTNQFDEVSAMFSDAAVDGQARNMSRADFAGTFPTAPTGADFVATDEIINGHKAYVAAEHLDPNAEMPTTGAKNGLTLINMRGLEYDDPAWDLLLDQLTVDEITNVILNGAYNTAAIDSIAKPATTDLDGPAGFSVFMGAAGSYNAYTSAVVFASTWNEEVMYRMGEAVGEEGIANHVSGWYAPAMNTHRSPFAGRNFEYYSEDGVLAGKIAAACVSGASSKGVYSYIKHFALNDQESVRTNALGAGGVSTWANEQAIREIYLKPFEIVVKTASAPMNYIADEDGTIATKDIGATAVMSSFNRIGTTWAGGHKGLMTNVLRDEWGFRGIVITDFNLYPYMSPDQGIAAGSDHMLTFAPMKSLEDTTSATAVTNLRKAAHNVLYAVANSNAMNGIAPGVRMIYHMPTWRIVQIAVDVVLGVAWVACVARLVMKKRSDGSTTAREQAVKA